MIMRLFWSLGLFITFFTGLSFSQGIAIGEWRDHLPYSSVICVASAPNTIYAATPYSLFYLDEEDLSITRLSKVNGLSDIGITSIAYCNSIGVLVVAYSNANIDLLFNDGTIINIPDIKRKNLVGNKTINNICIQGSNAWLSCGFGIVVLDLARIEIKDTYFIGNEGAHINVADIAIDADSIYAASDVGVYTANLNSPNLAFFANWRFMTELPSPSANYQEIEFFNDKLILCQKIVGFNNDSTFIRESGIWNMFALQTNTEVKSIRASSNFLAVTNYDNVQLYNSDLSYFRHVYTYHGDYPQPMDAVFTVEEDFIYIGDQNYGLVKNWDSWNADYIQPEGPYSSSIFKLTQAGDQIAGVAGGRDGSWGNLFHQSIAYQYKDENWNSFYSFNTAGMDTIYDLIAIAISPTDPGRIFAGSFGRGLLEFQDGNLTKVYNAANSNISEVSGADPEEVKVGALKFDENNNLWIATCFTGDALSVLEPSGVMTTFSLSSVVGSNVISDIAIDENGYKWMIMPRSGGIVVFDDNQTPSVKGDDRFIKLSTSEGLGMLPSMNVFSIVVDRNGDIWIGTDKGIAVFYSPENVFEGSGYDAQQILVDIGGGSARPLLESEGISALCVDGANRKWIGTEKAGVFLMSEDGLTEEFHFTTENSPLLSDNITSIAIQPSSGEVFFGTFGGIISFRGTATEPIEQNDSAFVFPNPVLADFNGYIAISNLPENCSFTIADIYGNLVYSAEALGGQAIWNGRDLQGEKPATGVYLIFVSNPDGSLTQVAKLLFFH